MSVVDAAAVRHRFTVHAQPDPNVLARIIEPFVVHDVLPARLAAATDPAGFVVSIEFVASNDLACRLGARIGAMPPVCRVTQESDRTRDGRVSGHRLKRGRSAS